MENTQNYWSQKPCQLLALLELLLKQAKFGYKYWQKKQMLTLKIHVRSCMVNQTGSQNLVKNYSETIQ